MKIKNMKFKGTLKRNLKGIYWKFKKKIERKLKHEF